MGTARCAGLAVVLICALAAVPAWADRLSLPNLEHRLPLTASARDRIAAAFPPRGPLHAAVQRAIIDQLPPAYGAACRDLVRHWGPDAAGTERLGVRVLSSQARVYFLALRCDSTRAEFAGFSDERLVTLRLDPGHEALFTVPQGTDCEHCTELARLSPNPALSTPAGTAAGFRVDRSADNPCCGYPDRLAERLHLYLLSAPERLYAVLALLLQRDAIDHTNPERDLVSTYHARVRFDADAAGRITAVQVAFDLKTDDRAARHGRIQYLWSPQDAAFVETPARSPSGSGGAADAKRVPETHRPSQ